MPNFIKVGNEDAEFAASLAEAAGEEPEADEPEPEDPGTGGENDEPGEPEASDQDDSNDLDDAGDSDGSEENGEADAPVADLSAIGQLFVDGDMAGACKALGIDPKIFELNEPKFRAMRQGLKDARAKEAAAQAAQTQAEQSLQRANQIIADGKKQYGHLVDLKHSLARGEWLAAKELLEELAPAGTTFQQIAEGIVQSARGVTPGEAAARRRLKELERAEAERKAKEEETARKALEEQAAAQQKARNLRGAEERLRGTDFEGVDGAAEKLVEIVASNWDYERGGLKIKPEECLKKLGEDPIISKLVKLKKLESRQAGKPTRATPARDTTGRFVPPARHRGIVGKRPAVTTPEKTPQKVKPEDEFAASIREATRLEAAERRARRAAR